MYFDSGDAYWRRGQGLFFSLKNIVKGQRRDTRAVEEGEELNPKKKSESRSFYDYLGNKTIGIATDEVQVGDQIVLVSGVRTPLVLRRDGLSNRLVSPALVLGPRLWMGRCGISSGWLGSLRSFRFLSLVWQCCGDGDVPSIIFQAVSNMKLQQGGLVSYEHLSMLFLWT